MPYHDAEDMMRKTVRQEMEYQHKNAGGVVNMTQDMKRYKIVTEEEFEKAITSADSEGFERGYEEGYDEGYRDGYDLTDE